MTAEPGPGPGLGAGAARACPDENMLARFVQGEATEDERARVEAHVDRCAACAELLAQLAYAYFDEDGDRELDRDHDRAREREREPEGATAREAPLAKRLPVGTVVAGAPPTLLRGGAAESTAEVIATGAIVGGRYEIGPRIGRGGMGVVYAGRDPVLRRPVAVKVMNALAAPSDEERLLREARAMARVAHPEVVTVYDAGKSRCTTRAACAATSPRPAARKRASRWSAVASAWASSQRRSDGPRARCGACGARRAP
jgi:hypothetical protein